jgi:hypothetical protein
MKSKTLSETTKGTDMKYAITYNRHDSRLMVGINGAQIHVVGEPALNRQLSNLANDRNIDQDSIVIDIIGEARG